MNGAQKHCHLQYSAVTCTEHTSLPQFVIQKDTLECVSLCGWVSSPGLAPNGSRGKAAGVLTQEGGDALTASHNKYHQCR